MHNTNRQTETTPLANAYTAQAVALAVKEGVAHALSTHILRCTLKATEGGFQGVGSAALMRVSRRHQRKHRTGNRGNRMGTPLGTKQRTAHQLPQRRPYHQMCSHNTNR